MKKYSFSVLYSLIALGVLLMLFHFSGQNATISNGLSGRITAKIFELFHYEYTAQELESLNLVIRKMAHFTLFFLLGFGLTGAIRGIKPSWAVPLAIVFGAGCAMCDEFHQYFVQGRSASMYDVLLDSCGVIVGTFACYGLHKIWLLRKKQKKERRE